MSAVESSAEMLRRYWDRYTSGYAAKLGRPPTMRETSKAAGLDPSSLSRWTGTATPPDRRIPPHFVPVVATALLLTDDQADELMDACIREVSDRDRGIVAMYAWFVDFYRRTTSPKLDAEEVVVLRSFNEARDRWPRGLYGNLDEPMEIRRCFEEVLCRAEGLHAEEAVAEEGVPPPGKERLERVKRKLQAAQRDVPSVYALAKKEAKRLRATRKR